MAHDRYVKLVWNLLDTSICACCSGFDFARQQPRKEKFRDKCFGEEHLVSRADADRGNKHVWKFTVFIYANVVTDGEKYLPMVGSTTKYSRGGVRETKSVRSPVVVVANFVLGHKIE